MSHNAGKTLVSLPYEVLIAVFKFLRFSDLNNVILVCRHFRTVGEDPVLWKRIHLNIDYFVPIGKIPRLSLLKKLTVHGEGGFYPPEELFEQISNMNLKNLFLVLTDLTFEYINISPRVLAKAVNSVECFLVSNDDLPFMTKFQLEKILIGLMKGSRLKYLDLGTLLSELDISPALISEAVPILQTFRSTGSDRVSWPINRLIEELSLSTSNLSMLDIQCHSLKSIEPECLASAIFQIETVVLEYCDLSVAHVTKICKKLNEESSKLRNLNIDNNNYNTGEKFDSVVPKALNKLKSLTADPAIFTRDFFTEMSLKSNLNEIGPDVVDISMPSDILARGLNRLEKLKLNLLFENGQGLSKSTTEAVLLQMAKRETNIKLLKVKGSLDWLPEDVLSEIKGKAKIERFSFYG